jgi:hypothetical protein
LPPFIRDQFFADYVSRCDDENVVFADATAIFVADDTENVLDTQGLLKDSVADLVRLQIRT